MKRFAVIIACTALALTVGCASTMNERPVAATNPTTGEVLLDKDGNPIMGTAKYSDEEANYQAQAILAKARKPVSALEAAPKTETTYVYNEKGEVVEKKVVQGYQDIKLSGVKSWYTWGRNGMELMLKRYITQAEALLMRFTELVDKAAWPVATIKVADTVSESKGTTFKDSFNNNQGNQSAAGRVNGGVSNTNVSGEGNTGTSSANPEDTSTSTSSNGGNSLLSGGTN